MRLALGTEVSHKAARAPPEEWKGGPIAGRSSEAELAMFSRTDYSDACPLAMQRRYPMQDRTTPIFWLLLAATLLVDLLAVVLVFGDNQRNHQVFVLYLSLAYGQLSLLCVWTLA